jgi:hypothetical protein
MPQHTIDLTDEASAIVAGIADPDAWISDAIVIYHASTTGDADVSTITEELRGLIAQNAAMIADLRRLAANRVAGSPPIIDRQRSD